MIQYFTYAWDNQDQEVAAFWDGSPLEADKLLTALKSEGSRFRPLYRIRVEYKL